MIIMMRAFRTVTVINYKKAKSYFINTSVPLQKSASYTLPLATVFRPRKRESGETNRRKGGSRCAKHCSNVARVDMTLSFIVVSSGHFRNVVGKKDSNL